MNIPPTTTKTRHSQKKKKRKMNIVNQKQCHIPSGNAEIHHILKDLKDAGVLISINPHSSLLSFLCRKHMGVYHKLSQVVTPIAAAV